MFRAMTDQTADIRIPLELLPADGRFGSGPSKVRVESLRALAATGTSYMGTSHRQKTVKDVVARARRGMAELLGLPDGYEVLLGNGGATAFWDVAGFRLVRDHSHHAVFGEFSSKFAQALEQAPHIATVTTDESAPGTHPVLTAVAGADAYALTQNETSTGVCMPVARPTGAAPDALVLVDATSGAGGMHVDPAEFDVYYLSPQKALASDGGLWLAACSPRALARIDDLADRWCPASLDLLIARGNSMKYQTYNTPALATIFLLVEQVECADFVVLNKVDMLEKKVVESLEAIVSSLNPLAKVYTCEHGKVDIDELVGPDVHGLVRDDGDHGCLSMVMIVRHLRTRRPCDR